MGEVIRRTKGGKFLGWYLRYYDETGKRRQLASKQPTQVDARKMLVQIEARIARGEAGIEVRPRLSLTFAGLVEQFMSAYDRPRIKDIDAYKRQRLSVLQKVLPTLGKLIATHIRPEDIARLRDVLLRRFARGTVKNVLATLSAIFSWAVRQGLAQKNPCQGIERPTPDQSVDFLTREEVRALLNAAAADARSRRYGRIRQVAVTLAVYTGMRKGELFGLRWQDVDLDTRRLTVARSYDGATKSGKPRHLRLPAELVPLLREWREECRLSPTGLVLAAGNGPRRLAGPGADLGLGALLRRAGLRTFPHPWHALRHTFASNFIMSGGNMLTLQKILGHSDIKMTLIYAHLAPDFLGDEMDRLKY